MRRALALGLAMLLPGCSSSDDGTPAGPGAGGAGAGGASGAAGSAGGGAGQAGSAGQSPSSPLDAMVEASLTKVDPLGFETFAVKATLATGKAPVTLTHARVLFAHEGGYAFLVGDIVKQSGSFFGAGPTLEAGASKSLPLSFAWSTPTSNVVVGFSGTSGDTPFEVVAEGAIVREGFEAPAALGASGPVALGVRGPLVAVETLDGDTRLPIVAQIVPFTARQVIAQSFTVAIDGGEATAFPKASSLTGVPTSVVVAKGAAPKTAHFEAKVTVDGEPLMLARDVPVTTLAPVAVASPLQGTWSWLNGPAEDVLHTHHQFPEQRFAYDIVVKKGGVTHTGDADLNTSYFAFDQPFFAALPGKVIYVDDANEDNDGATATAKNPDGVNNDLVLERDDGVRCVYAHLRKGSSKVKVGDVVAAGAELGRVGNAGQSTEPHLHFACFRVSATGRVEALPLSLTVAGKTGTPVGGEDLTTP